VIYIAATIILRPDLNAITPFLWKCWGGHVHFLTPMSINKNLPWIRHYTPHAILLLFPDLKYGFQSSEAVYAAPGELLNVTTCHEGALTGQKMLRCCTTFTGLWGPCTWWTCLNSLVSNVSRKLTLLMVKLGKKPLTTTRGKSESLEAIKSLMRGCFEPTPCSSRLKLWQLKFNGTKQWSHVRKVKGCL